uniref:Uncharacterized protein n=1 Tax=Anguilla anguilla TaxID=7936 RepID=A0A0E9UCE0_ANGAN
MEFGHFSAARPTEIFLSEHNQWAADGCCEVWFKKSAVVNARN